MNVQEANVEPAFATLRRGRGSTSNAQRRMQTIARIHAAAPARTRNR
jgi:hypothetical protein